MEIILPLLFISITLPLLFISAILIEKFLFQRSESTAKSVLCNNKKLLKLYILKTSAESLML